MEEAYNWLYLQLLLISLASDFFEVKSEVAMLEKWLLMIPCQQAAGPSRSKASKLTGGPPSAFRPAKADGAMNIKHHQRSE